MNGNNYFCIENCVVYVLAFNEHIIKMYFLYLKFFYFYKKVYKVQGKLKCLISKNWVSFCLRFDNVCKICKNICKTREKLMYKK